MGFVKSLIGIGVIAGTSLLAIKVAKKYQENKSIEQMVNGYGEIPFTKETSEVIGDVAKATTEVVVETGIKVKDVFCEFGDKISHIPSKHIFEDDVEFVDEFEDVIVFEDETEEIIDDVVEIESEEIE